MTSTLHKNLSTGTPVQPKETAASPTKHVVAPVIRARSRDMRGSIQVVCPKCGYATRLKREEAGDQIVCDGLRLFQAQRSTKLVRYALQGEINLE